VTYACHCTTLGGKFNQIAGDWAGYAQTAIEADQPGSIAMITIGCGADANPHPRADDLAVCERQGRQLADEVKRVLKEGLHPLPGSVVCRSSSIELPFAEPRTREEWQHLAQNQDATGYHARQFLTQLDRGEKLPSTLNYPICTWTFGNDLALVFLGGEVVVDYAIRLHREFAHEKLWIVAYSNDVPCYIPSKRILREGGYEADRSMAYYARPHRFSEDVEDLILDAVQKLLPHAFYSPAKQIDFPPPMTPEESRAAIRVLDGWKVELVAAEPLIADPVAFDWGLDGRLWVAEMGDYPNGANWHQPGDPLGEPGGRIKVLTDTDGDGRFDKATIFQDKLPFPNGIKVWRRGVLVTAAPSILYLEDIDGDDRADKQEELFTGFVEGNQQHRVNGLRWGIDQWLYVANGDSGGRVKSAKTGQEISISGRDLCVRPDDGAIEALSGQTQFGRCQDDWNNWFGGNNANPLWHYVLDDHYLRRNPQFSPPAVRRDVPEFPGTAPVFPASRTLARFNDFHTANRFTSACAPDIYRDELLLDRLGAGTDHVFICEPVHNLVHHQLLIANGLTFTSRRADAERSAEFFASADNWSRPVMVRTGPDGAIWIADMYRQVIEHPQWIPVNWQRKLDLRAGSELGRIYRVSPVTETSRRAVPRLDTLDSAGLTQLLENPSGWIRDMAQQCLLWRKDRASVPLLQRMAISSREPRARVPALYLLSEFQTLPDETLLSALNDSHPGVRRHAVRLAESRLNESAAIAERIVALAKDPEITVTMQVAYSLGEWDSAAAGEPLAEIALDHPGDEVLTAAVLSSVTKNNVETLTTRVLTARQPPAALVQKLLAIAAGFDDQKGVNQIVREALKRSSQVPEVEQFAAAEGLLTAVRRQQKTAGKSFDPESRERLEKLFAAARAMARDEAAPAADRVAAVRLLGVQMDSPDADAALLATLLTPRLPPELQFAAMSALIVQFPRLAPRLILAGWQSHVPSLRAAILDELFTKTDSVREFLSAVERGEVPTSHIDARRRQQLVTHFDSGIRERAAALFATGSAGTRAQVVEQFQPVTNLTGDSGRGKATFGKRCAVCHKLEDTGQNVGPDLTALTDKSSQSMLVAILDPNRAVEDKFLEFVAVTSDGRQIAGIVSNETSSSVTLTGQEAKQVTLLRKDIDVLHASGKSLMPEGMEKDLSEQDLADVIAYVRSVSVPPKQFPGNRPELAHVRDDGSIRLLAMNAKIYGPKLVFEEKYRNLGYWQSPDDHAVWMLQVPRAGKYQVRIEYACDDSAAGDRLIVTVGDQTVGGVVRGTGSWDQYRSMTAGTIHLPAGYAELVVRSDGTIRSALIDLRQIILEPR
jgi:putative membrane-bound dehydrogenase-like protein